MTYSLLKVLHVLAIVTWTGTMLVTPWLVVWADRVPGVQRARLVERLHRLFRRMATPAMLATWVFGLAIASLGGWLGMPWLHVKLVLVVLLSGVHGLLSGQLRRLGEDGSYRAPQWVGVLPWAELALLAGIVTLVIVMPGASLAR